MKRIYIIALLLSFVHLTGNAQERDIFNELSDMDGVSSVYISKAMFKLMSGMDVKTNDLDLEPFIGKLESVQILSTENAEAIAKMRKAFQYIQPKNGYEELMRVKEDGETMRIFMKQGKEGMNEFVLKSEEKAEYNLIVITGSLTLEEMQQVVDRE